MEVSNSFSKKMQFFCNNHFLVGIIIIEGSTPSNKTKRLYLTIADMLCANMLGAKDHVFAFLYA